MGCLRLRVWACYHFAITDDILNTGSSSAIAIAAITPGISIIISGSISAAYCSD